ncbi:uncharacterized protein LY89DRAFT_669190 [Mollisia scopiformis]|uniref:Uncharacterized protein n=1 Tax=Mollisia scopiformis TaxID=149040 RepID=A0A194XAD5_MOLSC|nr:uncharacterized protein LY89DRAFT_669190 [Mollisia scopiformis]KUJ16727.1 hypothetical protein LY89DRAFT_669190 [Mollisia scopiformis]
MAFRPERATRPAVYIAARTQAIGRARRHGQTRPVFVYNLLTAGTIDVDYLGGCGARLFITISSSLYGTSSFEGGGGYGGGNGGVVVVVVGKKDPAGPVPNVSIYDVQSAENGAEAAEPFDRAGVTLLPEQRRALEWMILQERKPRPFKQEQIVEAWLFITISSRLYGNSCWKGGSGGYGGGNGGVWRRFDGRGANEPSSHGR